MARSSGATANRPVTMGAVIALAVALVLFVGYMAYSNFVAPPKAAPLSPQAKAQNDRLTELALQSGGDIGKLNDQDRNWVNSTTGGYGAMVLRQLASRKK